MRIILIFYLKCTQRNINEPSRRLTPGRGRWRLPTQAAENVLDLILRQLAHDEHQPAAAVGVGAGLGPRRQTCWRIGHVLHALHDAR